MAVIIPYTNKITYTGTWQGLPFRVDMICYVAVVNIPLLGQDDRVRWDDFYYMLDHTKKQKFDQISNGDHLYAHQIGVSLGRENKIYALLHREIELAPASQGEGPGSLLDQLDDMLEWNYDLGEVDPVPPNQLEGVIDHKLTDTIYYCPINPPVHTTRRTLSYVNYILDTNTVIKGTPGVGYEPNGIRTNSWVIRDHIRNSMVWPRTGVPGLTSNEYTLCDNSQVGGGSSESSIAMWKGFNTFNKLPYSTVAAPVELYYWPASNLRRFRGHTNYITYSATSTYHSTPIATHWPVVVTDPPGASGWISDISYSTIGDWCRENKFLHPYSRPYLDESDGSGTWHGLA